MARNAKQHDAFLRRIMAAAVPREIGGGVTVSIGTLNQGTSKDYSFYWLVRTKHWRASSKFYKRISDAERGLRRFLEKYGNA